MRNLAAALATGVCLVAMASPAQAQAQEFRIPAGSLKAALDSFAKQSGRQVIYRADEVRGSKSPGVTGALNANAALDRLLAGTGFTVRRDSSGALAIVRSNVTSRTPVSQTASSTGDASPGTREAGTASSSGEADAGSAEDYGESGEIVVTAQRREQRLRDVPISMSVFTSSDIERRGLVNSEDYLRGIPGTNQVDSANGQSIVIRGMETRPQNQNFFIGATTATYFGETPTTSSAGLASGTAIDLKLVDIERVEVLRGPQGTSFGNSSLGGAVRTIPAAPDLSEIEGRAVAGYSRTGRTGGDNYTLQAVANVPLVPGILAVRAAGYRFRDEGYYRNVAGSDPAFRAAVVTPYQVQDLAKDVNHVGTTVVTGGRLSLLFQPEDDLRIAVNFLHQDSETDGIPVATVTGYDQAILQVRPNHTVRGETGGVADTQINLLNATVEKRLEWATFLASYSHTSSHSTVSQSDQLYGFNFPTSSLGDGHHKEDVFEGRIVTTLNGPLNFVAGAYHENIRDTYLFDYRWDSPTLNLFTGTNTDLLGTQNDKQRIRQSAVFGEATWQLTPKLSATGGVRVFHFNRRVQSVFSGPLLAAPPVDQTSKKSNQSYRANLSYKPSDRGLFYATFSQGFRLGKPQAGVAPGICDPDGDGIINGTNIPIASTRVVNSDKVNSYEIGTKLSTSDGRGAVDAAVFRMDWDDIPVTVTAGSRPTSCGRAYVTNAGKARSEGVEVQASYKLTPSTSLELGGSYINARLVQDVPSSVASQNFHAGDRLPGSPRYTGNAAFEQRFPLGESQASLRIDAIYIGPFFGDILESARLRAGDYVKVDVSGRITFGNFDLTLYARNLFNEDAFTFRATQPAIPVGQGYRLRPRTIGAQVGYRF